jgi:hypothetical protein
MMCRRAFTSLFLSITRATAGGAATLLKKTIKCKLFYRWCYQVGSY